MQAYTPPRKTFGFLGNNRLITLSLGVVVMTVVFTWIFVWAYKHNVNVVADGKTYKVSIFGGTVAEALEKSGVVVRERDLVQPARTEKLREGMVIGVTRAKTIAVVADGKTREIVTPVITVAELLEEANLALGPQDRVTPDLNEKIAAGDVIRIIRVKEKTISESYPLAFRVERRNDPALDRGLTKVLREGQDGLGQRTVKIVIEDGKEVRREVVGTKVVRDPVTKLVAMGTLRTKIVSRGSRPIKFSKVITMNASGYTYTGNRTASGVAPHRGAVAVDPRVIPMGTKLYIEGYGYGKALDVGSAIKGNKIDLFFESRLEALKWGRRPVKVYIID
jgi:uncharacterized protein YabE (DUF348 family)